MVDILTMLYVVYIHEQLRQCLIAAAWDNTPDATSWYKVVSIVQVPFRDGTLVEECTW